MKLQVLIFSFFFQLSTERFDVCFRDLGFLPQRIFELDGLEHLLSPDVHPGVHDSV